MNRFFAKEVVIHRRDQYWPRYPEYLQWCRDNIGVRGKGWEWKKGWIERGAIDPLCSVQSMTFQFERDEDFVMFRLVNM